MSLSLRLLKKPKEEDKLSHTTMEEFQNELKDIKKHIKWNKKLKLLREQEINQIKNERKKVKYSRWWNERYFRKVRCKFNDFRTKM